MLRTTVLLATLSVSAPLLAQLRADGATASFRGSLPPKPTVVLPPDSLPPLQTRLSHLSADFAKVKNHERAADADIFLKAVRYALEFEEWFDKKPEDSLKKAQALLDEAELRITALKADRTPWLAGSGQKVLGFYSKIDDSPQPYGVEIPEGLEFGKGKPPVPMWIWLHGRGDTTTDLNFVHSRLNAKKPGQFQPPGTIIIHPFGRYCNGWKSAGETDVFECRDDAVARFNIDENRIALAGFSMGGAGAWHLGAHFADQWACVHAGAGFVDVKRYQKLTPEKFPPWYEQKLWGVYDVPLYARNFLNLPLVCYSGETDTQRDAAEYMMQVLGAEGLKPPHFIGPGMGHKYHPEVIKEVQAAIHNHVQSGRVIWPEKISLQTQTLAYSKMHWLAVTGLSHHWEDARADAIWDKQNNQVQLTTHNVSALTLLLPQGVDKVILNGREEPGLRSGSGRALWSWSEPARGTAGSVPKKPGLQGPIDDGFKSRFVIVLPDLPGDDSAADKWSRAEAAHFLKRWRSLMRGDPLVRRADQLTDRDAEDAHLVIWGTPKTNTFLQKLLTTKAIRKVLTWDDSVVKIGTHQANASSHIPVLCHPNPMSPSKYIIINSGLTFREAHDRTNSLQNPKLPDWAILNITSPPTADSAGAVVAADFFDENWQVKAAPSEATPTHGKPDPK